MASYTNFTFQQYSTNSEKEAISTERNIITNSTFVSTPSSETFLSVFVMNRCINYCHFKTYWLP